jgi:hypothetical protein
MTRVRVTLWLVVYCQSACLGAKPLEAHNQRFLQLNPCSHSPYVTPSLMTGWVCPSWISFAFVKRTYHTHNILLKSSSLWTAYMSCRSRLRKADHIYLTYLMLQQQLSHLTVVSLTAARFKPLIFSLSGFTLSYTANMFILMIWYDFCILPAQFCYTIIYIQKTEGLVQIVDSVHYGKFPVMQRTLFCRHCNFKK